MRHVNEIVYIMAIIVFGTGSGAQAEWEFQENGVTETLNDVFFVDELHGWAVGDNSTIIATTDGGEIWERQNYDKEGYT